MGTAERLEVLPEVFERRRYLPLLQDMAVIGIQPSRESAASSCALLSCPVFGVKVFAVQKITNLKVISPRINARVTHGKHWRLILVLLRRFT